MKTKLFFPIAFFGLLCSSAVSAQCAEPIVSPPYTMGFEEAEDIDCIIYEDVNGGTESGWGIYDFFPTETGTNSMVYVYDSEFPGDDWFYTPGMNMVGGVTYQLNFLYRSGLGVMFLFENLEVKYGTSPNAEAMTTTLFTAENIDTSFDSDFESVTVSFTPPLSGNYYIGFHSYSEADQGYIQIDDLSVTSSLALGDFNRAALSYNNPVSDILTIDYPNVITAVALYNLIGQQVQVNASADLKQLDMTNLSSGTYIVKLTSDGVSQSVKVLKQ